MSDTARESRGATDAGTPDGARIVIVGMAGRFPGAQNLAQFWRNLRAGVESISFLSREELLGLGVDPAWLNNPNFVPARPYLEDRDLFDASFFGYGAQEAEIIDPQQRLFLEVAWEALEDAGYAPDTLDCLVGLYAGSSQNTYLWFNLLRRPQFFERYGMVRTIITNSADFLATRAAFKLNLRGPAVTVQTACSTSLVAVHLACQGLLNYECDLALAGGVSLRITPIVGYLYESGGLLSRDGHCRAFDREASGTLFGDGVGIVVLKRLEDAEREGDTIHAVVRGSAVNNDGSRKAGFTAPAPAGQAAVVFQALQTAGVDADSISYVETHGTGTELGDPIEVTALTKAFRASTARRGFCALGSVKSNIGHLDAAAGIAGLIKTVLALEHRELPPSLHFRSPNPNIDFGSSPFFVNAALRAWTTEAGPRRAGVSAFGMGGTNAHVVLEEAPAEQGVDAGGAARDRGRAGVARAALIVVSARSERAVERAAAELARHCRTAAGEPLEGAPPELELEDAAYTLSVGRRAFQHRLAVVARTWEEAAARLEESAGPWRATGAMRAGELPVVFLFPGTGAQYAGMARGIYEAVPRFRARVDELSAALEAAEGWDLRALLYEEGADSEALQPTAAAQPALFVMELALAELWESWGVRPRAMLGRGIGEYVAATRAGVFRWEDALRLVAARGRLMQGGAPGASPTPMMEPLVAAFQAKVAGAPRQPPTRRWVSNVTGTWVTAAQATAPTYWAEHVWAPVRFAEGVAALLAEGAAAVLEVGPGRTLGRFVRQHPAGGEVTPWATLGDAGQAGGAWEQLLLTLGHLWTSGVAVEWSGVWAEARRRRRPLPTYPFERQRYWSDPENDAPRTPTAGEAPPARASTRRVGGDRVSNHAAEGPVDDWFAVPGWTQSPILARPPAPTSGPWLVLLDDDGFCGEIVDELARRGESVVTVRRASTFMEAGPGAFRLRLDEPADYATLLARLEAGGLAPRRIVCGSSVRLRADGDPAALDRDAFFVPLAVAQALSADPRPIRLGVLTANAFDVTGGDGLLPEGALASGVTRVAGRELTHVLSRTVDLPLVDGSRQAWPSLARLVLDELAIDDRQPVVAYRNSRRWVQNRPAESSGRAWRLGTARRHVSPHRRTRRFGADVRARAGSARPCQPRSARPAAAASRDGSRARDDGRPGSGCARRRRRPAIARGGACRGTPRLWSRDRRHPRRGNPRRGPPRAQDA